ncbi:ARM repeat-containing protein [Yamadazyma tenuis ATCC 10573]|uniref:ARM repeat-containing protein n=1 Tax=Candida tenuis (strain ATCC 10573 / BCRC 21748 / CBS 615 / JCM 9827 / NBRC 10315 / NRRL Y-1498 / VKM Y-70) TaxID=590646 RepID=G3BCZ1_CANTC|nr:ARM repeat-containing protein [Yamadazyma tenuis ATCC 10573]EGV60242.1 ARM repeat-containing protein [Yamadazyma tenuis ATCC 10573]
MSKGGMQGRFGQLSGRGGQYDGRQGSRNGSKRRGGSTRDKSKRNNQSKRRDDEGKSTIPPEDVKPLEKSANRWVPKPKTSEGDQVNLAPDGVTVILNEEEVERKVKRSLNKLTLEMFEPITDDILKITEQSRWEDDAKTVKQVISLTFAKATDEPYWSSMYAQFCAKMCKMIPDDVSVKETTRDGKEIEVSGGSLARRLLLTTCQQEYEKGWSDKVPFQSDGAPLAMMSDEYYEAAKAKRRGLGLVKFIGQLYLLNMLTDKVVVYCLTNLSKNVEDPSEDSLESLAQLVTAIGPKFEQSERNRNLMQVVFENIQKILDTLKLSSRIKFMLMDLKDLRNAGWVSSNTDQGPKTIKEIHDDAEIKRLEDEKAANERRRKNKGGDSRSNSSRAGSNWGSQPKRVESTSKLTPVKDSKGFTAVSRSQSSRLGESSNLSPREGSKRSESLQSATNIFAALGGEEDHEHEPEHEHEEVATNN